MQAIQFILYDTQFFMYRFFDLKSFFLKNLLRLQVLDF